MEILTDLSDNSDLYRNPPEKTEYLADVEPTGTQHIKPV
jgi:hypothetical protein